MHERTLIYQTAQIRALESLAIDQFKISGLMLMQRAAKASLDFLLRRFPFAQHIAVYCGGGNNGGDGYALAYLLHEKGLSVKVWQVGGTDHLSAEADACLQLCRQVQVSIEEFKPDAHHDHADLIVDALCGIGLKSDLYGNIKEAVTKLSRLQKPVLALDMPTGINADTGSVCGVALRATATITFIGLKLGLLTGSGKSYSGEVVVNDLLLPPEIFRSVTAVVEKLSLSRHIDYLKPRMMDWHKGLSGHVLIVGGDLGLSGAAALAATAAYRVGAGLVTIATRMENAPMLNINRPELMCVGIGNRDALEPLIKKAQVIVVGPGLGQTGWSKSLFDRVIQTEVPLVVDADALNLLAKSPRFRQNWVSTPHPGEAARLLNIESHIIQNDRLSAVKRLQAQYGGTVVLKGAGSLVLSSQSDMPGLCDFGNPGMATAGTGDVLSGVIGGLIAQGVPPSDAARLGVIMHAKAGDYAAKEGERGMMAMDLMPHLRKIANPSLNMA